jgi:transposase
MKSKRLNDRQLDDLKRLHRTARDKRKADRIKAIVLLGKGWTEADVAEALLVDRKTIATWFSRYIHGGADKLLQDDYRGGLSYLTPQQLHELEQHLIQTHYLSTKEMIAYIEENFAVTYTQSGLTDMLHRLGFVYKKPKHVPGKADAKSQEEFIERYENLRKNSGDRAAFCFIDGVHLHHNSMPAFGWFKRGQEAQLKANTGRQRININGAIDVESHQMTTDFTDSVNAQSTIRLFRKLEKKYSNKEVVYVFCDNARYYRSKKVKKYLEASKIEIIFLPPYSPNLNLIERLWKFFKKKVLYNRCYETLDEFSGVSRSFFRKYARWRPELKTLLAE